MKLQRRDVPEMGSLLTQGCISQGLRLSEKVMTTSPSKPPSRDSTAGQLERLGGRRGSWAAPVSWFSNQRTRTPNHGSIGDKGGVGDEEVLGLKTEKSRRTRPRHQTFSTGQMKTSPSSGKEKQ